jgi:anti-sigma factor ChrR (cupin superfamily)
MFAFLAIAPVPFACRFGSLRRRVDGGGLTASVRVLLLAAAFAAASSPRVEPSIEQRARILTAIAATPQLHRKTAETAAPNGYTFLTNSSEGWEDTDSPGFRTKLLSRRTHPGHEVMLIALASGAKVPDHDHTGTEIYILSGHLHTEGRVIGPGDFLRAEAGTHPHEVVSPDGCMALMILGPALAAKQPADP